MIKRLFIIFQFQGLRLTTVLWQKNKGRFIQGPNLPKSFIEMNLLTPLTFVNVNSTHLLILGYHLFEETNDFNRMHRRCSLIHFKSQIWHHFNELLPFHNKMLYSGSGIIQTNKKYQR